MDLLTRTEAAEKEIDNFIDRMADKHRDGRNGAEQANAEAARQREIDRKRLAAMREENRAAWIMHLRKTARAHLRIARSARARARKLEKNGETA